MSVALRVVAVAAAGLALSACAYGEKSFAKFSAAHPTAELLPVEFVKQTEAADCGAAALTSVGRFWGVEVKSGSIFSSWGPANTEAGYSIAELRDVSEKLGLTSSRLLEQPEYVLGLVDSGMPVIAPVEKAYQREDIFDWMLASMLSRLIVSAFVAEEPTVNHYVVVLGADDTLVYMLDPQDGYRAMTRVEFTTRWNELTLSFVPDAGASVAALAAYRAPPLATFDISASGVTAPVAATSGFASSDFGPVQLGAVDEALVLALAAQGARSLRAP